MGHPHTHAHHHRPHDRSHDPRAALGFALVLIVSFLGVEVGVGWWSGSLALLSDAAHMASDAGALILALGAAQLARLRATPDRTFGLARAEVLGAFVNGLGLLLVCGFIAREGLQRLAQGPPDVPGMPVLVVGTIGLVINLVGAFILHRADHGDLNVRGAMLHMLSDALGSVAAIVAAVFLLNGVAIADSIASLVVAGLVAVGAIGLVRDAGRVLLELPPRDLDVTEVHRALVALDGVVEVHDLHAWSLDGRTPLVSAHLVVQGGEADEVCDRARTMLDERFHAHHTTLQIETTSRGCAVRCGDG